MFAQLQMQHKKVLKNSNTEIKTFEMVIYVETGKIYDKIEFNLV